MPCVRDDKAEAKKGHMNFHKITWVVTERAGLGLRSLSSLFGCPGPAVTWGPSPGVRSVWEKSLLAGTLSLLFGKGWAIKAISLILSVFLLPREKCGISRN